jgi:hypothetical protein
MEQRLLEAMERFSTRLDALESTRGGGSNSPAGSTRSTDASPGSRSTLQPMAAGAARRIGPKPRGDGGDDGGDDDGDGDAGGTDDGPRVGGGGGGPPDDEDDDGGDESGGGSSGSQTPRTASCPPPPPNRPFALPARASALSEPVSTVHATPLTTATLALATADTPSSALAAATSPLFSRLTEILTLPYTFPHLNIFDMLVTLLD